MTGHDNDTTPLANDLRKAAILSRKEAASYLGTSVRTFDRMQEGRVIPFVLVGKRRRYLLSDLDSYIKSRRSI